MNGLFRLVPPELSVVSAESADPVWETLSLMWWAYLHSNGSLVVKRWFWDVADYTTDCIGNDFVVRVIEPFPARSREEAYAIAKGKL